MRRYCQAHSCSLTSGTQHMAETQSLMPISECSLSSAESVVIECLNLILGMGLCWLILAMAWNWNLLWNPNRTPQTSTQVWTSLARGRWHALLFWQYPASAHALTLSNNLCYDNFYPNTSEIVDTTICFPISACRSSGLWTESHHWSDARRYCHDLSCCRWRSSCEDSLMSASKIWWIQIWWLRSCRSECRTCGACTKTNCRCIFVRWEFHLLDSSLSIIFFILTWSLKCHCLGLSSLQVSGSNTS